MSIPLRPYQLQALEAEDEHRAEHPDENRLLISLATGMGKTILFAERIRRFLETFDGATQRALVLVHTDELVTQAVEKVRLILGGSEFPWSVGVVKSDRNEVDADVIVASVQTLSRQGRKEQIQDVGYIVVDEAHHATASTYVSTLEHFGGMAGVPVLGVTATPERSDGAGLGSVWHNLVFSRSTTWAMRHGYLVDLLPYTVRIPGIDATAPDARLDACLADSIAPEAIVNAWVEKVGTASTVLFAPGVISAQEFASAFKASGVTAVAISGATPDAERRAILHAYNRGQITVLCNAMVLTEGWDSPRTKCVIVARPTKSVPLFVQMAGRGLRPWRDSEAPPRNEQLCVLLSVADAVNSLAGAADLSDRLSDATDGKSLLAMEDEWDIGAGIEDKPDQYVGPVRVEQWDSIVQQSTKAWKYTDNGVPFLPTDRRGKGYVFVMPVNDHWKVWAREPATGITMRTTSCGTAPDLELAMALAEDEAQERGGDVGALLADKTRAWRKAFPSAEMTMMARRAGVPEREIGRILTQRAAGKAGKLSDLIDKVQASKVLDPVAQRIKDRERASNE